MMRCVVLFAGPLRNESTTEWVRMRYRQSPTMRSARTQPLTLAGSRAAEHNASG